MYGFNYQAAIPLALKEASSSNPQCDKPVDQSAILAPAATVASIDCTTVSSPELAHVRCPVSWKVDPNIGVHGARRRNLVSTTLIVLTIFAATGIVLWFDVAFPGEHEGAPPIVLPTGPSNPTTHWHQTVSCCCRLLTLLRLNSLCATGHSLRGRIQDRRCIRTV